MEEPRRWRSRHMYAALPKSAKTEKRLRHRLGGASTPSRSAKKQQASKHTQLNHVFLRTPVSSYRLREHSECRSVLRVYTMLHACGHRKLCHSSISAKITQALKIVLIQFSGDGLHVQTPRAMMQIYLTDGEVRISKIKVRASRSWLLGAELRWSIAIASFLDESILPSHIRDTTIH